MLIIANARYKGGLSGGDNIYLHLADCWTRIPVKVWDMMDIDFRPFSLCYVWRIVLGCIKAVIDCHRYEFVYSASDFWMDCLPACILKIKGNKWVAGFYLYAPKYNLKYRISQSVSIPLIKWFADAICITNDSLAWGFPNKPKIIIHGGIDLKYSVMPNEIKKFDAVFCGRIHPTKGIDELSDIWHIVKRHNPLATLAVVGDGDMGIDYLKNKMKDLSGITYFGYLNEERFDVFKKSIMVLYPTHDNHFSMSPVEAMSCGCPLIMFKIPVLEYFKLSGMIVVEEDFRFAETILSISDMYLFKYKEYKWWSKQAYDYALTWDWKKRAENIYWRIQWELNRKRIGR